MGSTGQLFARNVEFESTFPELELDPIAKNRHGGRIGLLKPDPQVISRKLFTRDQSTSPDCNQGHGVREFEREPTAPTRRRRSSTCSRRSGSSS